MKLTDKAVKDTIAQLRHLQMELMDGVVNIEALLSKLEGACASQEDSKAQPKPRRRDVASLAAGQNSAAEQESDQGELCELLDEYTTGGVMRGVFSERGTRMASRVLAPVLPSAAKPSEPG